MELYLLFCVQVRAFMCPVLVGRATVVATRLNSAVDAQFCILSSGVVGGCSYSWFDAPSSRGTCSSISSTSAAPVIGLLQECYTIISGVRL